jgi:hypothetical protein
MNIIVNRYRDIAERAQKVIKRDGWTQRGMVRSEGFSLHGAVRDVATDRVDGLVVMAMLEWLGFDSDWHQSLKRGKPEVLRALDTDFNFELVQAAIGPQAVDLVDIMKLAMNLSESEIEALAIARHCQLIDISEEWRRRESRISAQLHAISSVDYSEPRRKSLYTLRVAAIRSTEYISTPDASDAVQDAMLAVATRDLIGLEDYAQEDYDFLMESWWALFPEKVTA